MFVVRSPGTAGSQQRSSVVQQWAGAPAPPPQIEMFWQQTPLVGTYVSPDGQVGEAQAVC